MLKQVLGLMDSSRASCVTVVGCRFLLRNRIISNALETGFTRFTKVWPDAREPGVAGQAPLACLFELFVMEVIELDS
jgi:hypothetical protein